MLPDWPSLKADIVRVYMRYVRARVRQRSAAGLVPRSRVHEGDRLILCREDGSVEDTEFRRAEGVAQLSLPDIVNLPLREMFTKLDPIADGLARSQSEALFRTIEEGSKKAGTVTDAQGRPLTAELFLETLEKMDLSFDSKGNFQWPRWIVSPAGEADAKREWFRLQSEPALRNRLVELVSRKREEWIAREADRILVG